MAYKHLRIHKKAIIYDLDNTIYAVSSIADQLFRALFQLIEESGSHKEDMDAIKDDIMRKPFQVVAAQYGFSKELTRQGIDLLKGMTYNGAIAPFSDYAEIRNIPADRYLVTTGFPNLQYSKIRGMGIEADFREVHVVDPSASNKTKKDVFADIMERHGYAPGEVLVVGDDPDSEIRAARELGIDAVLYDREHRHPQAEGVTRITHFGELREMVADGEW